MATRPATLHLPAYLSTEISALQFLDDSALWQAARHRLPLPDSERMEDLHRIDRQAGLSEAEVVVVRSHATRLLAERGHDIRILISGT